MLFLLRCLFWLGLVFSHIATLEGTNAAALASQSGRAASASAAGLGATSGALGRIALDAAGQRCRAEPEKCLALAAQVARITQDAAVLGQPPVSPGRDTLNSGDRVPAWRLRAD